MTARRGVRLQRAGCGVAGRNCSSGESRGPIVETARRTERDEKTIAHDGIESRNLVPPASKGLPMRCVALGASFFVPPMACSSRASCRASASSIRPHRVPMMSGTACDGDVLFMPQAGGTLRRADASSTRCSAAATLRRVRSMASAFTEIESIPQLTSCAANSG